MNNQLKIGVAGLLPSDWRKIDVDILHAVRSAGFSGVSVVIDKPLLADKADVQRVKHALDAAQIKCAQANGAYECLINKDSALRAEGNTRLGQILADNKTDKAAISELYLAFLARDPSASARGRGRSMVPAGGSTSRARTKAARAAILSARSLYHL